MSEQIILKIHTSEEHNYQHFSEEMHRNGLSAMYKLSVLTSPLHTFASEFIEHIAEHGMSSLLSYTISQEDITSSSTPVNLVESTYKTFVEKLAPAKTLIIVDPYFYNGKPHEKTEDLLCKIIDPIIRTLEKIIIISKNPNGRARQTIHHHLKALNPSLSIVDHASEEFHDRFWINPDTGVCIVMGASLNGIGRKVSIVDRLNNNDVPELLSLIKHAGITV